MNEQKAAYVLLSGFHDEELSLLSEAIAALGRSSSGGDPVNDAEHELVFAAAYDEAELRSQRAAALEDARPWCFCVPASDRGLLSAAANAREGRLLILPPEGRELKRMLSALGDDLKERSAGDAAFSGLEKLGAEFSWKTSELDVSRVCRRIARLLSESGFYSSRAGEDECALALEEALVNAMEHGNLALDSSLRPDDSLAEDLYEAEREKRLADPAFGGKLIRISVTIGPEDAVVVIEDEGAGFDVSKIDEEPTALDVSGKGFWLIKQPFDSAAYNEKGNRLELKRRRHG
jgi:anti-sigma regulatory factor (Ser/Thr protein kinase)